MCERHVRDAPRRVVLIGGEGEVGADGLVQRLRLVVPHGGVPRGEGGERIVAADRRVAEEGDMVRVQERFCRLPDLRQPPWGSSDKQQLSNKRQPRATLKER